MEIRSKYRDQKCIFALILMSTGKKTQKCYCYGYCYRLWVSTEPLAFRTHLLEPLEVFLAKYVVCVWNVCESEYFTLFYSFIFEVLAVFGPFMTFWGYFDHCNSIGIILVTLFFFSGIFWGLGLSCILLNRDKGWKSWFYFQSY